jgi:hypothetical protein
MSTLHVHPDVGWLAGWLAGAPERTETAWTAENVDSVMVIHGMQYKERKWLWFPLRFALHCSCCGCGGCFALLYHDNHA